MHSRLPAADHAAVKPALSVALPPSLARFLELWERKRGDRQFPSRADFTIADLRPWIGRLNLVAVEGDDGRFLVFCQESLHRYGREMTGKRMSDFDPAALAQAALADHRAFMAGSGVPMTKTVSGAFGGRVLCWTRLAVPLATDGTTIDKYFVALDFEIDRRA